MTPGSPNDENNRDASLRPLLRFPCTVALLADQLCRELKLPLAPSTENDGARAEAPSFTGSLGVPEIRPLDPSNMPSL